MTGEACPLKRRGPRGGRWRRKGTSVQSVREASSNPVPSPRAGRAGSREEGHAPSAGRRGRPETIGRTGTWRVPIGNHAIRESGQLGLSSVPRNSSITWKFVLELHHRKPKSGGRFSFRDQTTRVVPSVATGVGIRSWNGLNQGGPINGKPGWSESEGQSLMAAMANSQTRYLPASKMDKTMNALLKILPITLPIPHRTAHYSLAPGISIFAGCLS